MLCSELFVGVVAVRDGDPGGDRVFKTWSDICCVYLGDCRGRCAMLSTEGFEMAEFVVCLLPQVGNVCCPGRVVLKCYTKECCCFTDGDFLLVHCQVDIVICLQVWVFNEKDALCLDRIKFDSPLV